TPDLRAEVSSSFLITCRATGVFRAIMVHLGKLLTDELPIVGVPALCAREGARLESGRHFGGMKQIHEDESIEHDIKSLQVVSELRRTRIARRHEPFLVRARIEWMRPVCRSPGAPGAVTALAISTRSAKYSRRQSPTQAVIETPRAAASCRSCRWSVGSTRP